MSTKQTIHLACENSTPEPYKCTSCSFETPLLVTLKQHSTSHPPNTKLYTFNCADCDFHTYSRLILLKRHRTCRKTNVQASFRTDYATYVLHYGYFKHEKIQWFTCEQCPFETQWRCNLNKHVKMKHLPITKWFECEQCEFKSKFGYVLKKHVTKRHAKTHICRYCRSESVRSDDPRKYPNGEEVKRFRCDYCSFRTKWFGSLRMHLLSMHNRCICGNKKAKG